MFDWNDEELTYIIWGEAGESDDHIVPFPNQIEEKPPVLFGDSTKKETNPQTANFSSIDLKKQVIKSEPMVELDGYPKYGISKLATGLGVDSWDDGLDLSSSNATKGDPDSMGAATSDNITKSNKNGSVADETTQFNKDSGIFENAPEGGGEQYDFVDYGWANIGSFDDLDRMFSNGDTIFGDNSVGNVDELWLSSKDMTGSPMIPTPLSGDSSDSPLGDLRATIDQSDIKMPYAQDPGLSFASGFDKLNEITFCTPQDAQASIDNIEQSGGKSSILLNEKTLLQGRNVQPSQKPGYDGIAAISTDSPYNGNNRQKRLPKGHKSVKKVDAKQLHNITGTWTSFGSPLQQLNSQYASRMVNPCNPSILTPQRPLWRAELLQQKHFPGAPLVSPYGNMANHQYPSPPVLAQCHPSEGSHRVAPCSYEGHPMNENSLKDLEDHIIKPPVMTPKEKIEKLRRRQQMRAMLAIQKQQMQFGNQASVSEHSSMEGGKIEVDDSLSSLPSLEPNSPLEQDDSNNISMAFDNCSVEESVLYRLQDTISNLDLQIRLCIRNSLYRLAQSAMQRQYPTETSSANSRDDTLSNKDLVSHESMPDVETDTNPIDRTVAHLLFHRPLEFSGKSAEAPESPTSAKIPYQRKANLLKNLAKGYFPESLDKVQKATGLLSDGDQSRNVPSFITCEDASKIESTESKAEASK